MANIYSNVATSQLAARTDVSQAPNWKQSGGNARHQDVTVALTTANAITANPVFLLRLSAGSRLNAYGISVDFSAAPATTALTGKIGYYTANTDTPVAVDDACFGAGLAMGTAGTRVAVTAAGTPGTAWAVPIVFPYDVWIVVTWTTSTAPLPHNQTWHIPYTLG
jgi:hypothetical protein